MDPTKKNNSELTSNKEDQHPKVDENKAIENGVQTRPKSPFKTPSPPPEKINGGYNGVNI